MKNAVLVAPLLMLATPATAAVDPAAFSQLSFRQHPGAQLPTNALLEDSAAHELRLGAALRGRPSVVILEYLRCKNLCGLVLQGAVQAIASAGLAPGRDVDLVAISIDPRENARDAALAQAMYLKRFPDPAAAAAGVHFFTGSADEVRRIAAAVGFPYRYDKDSDQFMHPAGLVVTTSGGQISRYMLGLRFPPEQLRKAVAEASRGEVEPPVHPLLCLCFGYDPDEGSVAALTFRLVRIAAVGVVLACAALIGFLSFRRRSA